MISNKFKGTCYHCGTKVAAGAGFCFKSEGQWLCSCAEHKPEVQTVGTVERALRADGTVKMPFERENLPLLRAMPAARWNKADKVWSVSVADSDLPRTVELAKRMGLDIAPELLERASVKTAAALAADPRLYAFQVDGVDFLSRKDKALLADQMGLGKTVQVASALRGQNAPVIVVCPASLKYNWQVELMKWAPEYSVAVLSGRKSFRMPAAGEVIIVNYDILPKAVKDGYSYKLADFAAPEGLTLVLDEVQYAKNYKAARTHKVTALCSAAARVWALTGTPLMNKPFDLWGVLSATNMNRSVFGGFKKFLSLFDAHRDNWGGYHFGTPSAEVPERLRRVMLRRLRAEVLPDLPSKQYQTVVINDLDNSVIATLDALAENFDYDSGDLPPFEAYSAIRAQLAAARIPAMLEIVEQYEDSDTPLVVFSAHRAPIDTLKEREGWEVITGSTQAAERQMIVERFQAGELKGIGLTIMAGGTGLTLTHAHHELFVDLDWVPANNAQAEDRCARIGQEADSVHVTRMVSAHPLDQHVHALLAEKTAMAFAAIDNNAKGVKKSKTKKRLVKLAAATIDPALCEAVHHGLRLLAGVCDGACSEDGQGFNKFDTHFGKQLAACDTLTTGQVKAAARVIRKYRKQLPSEVNEAVQAVCEGQGQKAPTAA